MQARGGFNVLEMTTVMALVAVFCAIAFPRAATFIDRMEVRGAVTEADALFSTARHVAIARGTQAVLGIDVARGRIAVSVGTDTIQVREVGRAHGVQLGSNRTGITYSPIGVGYGASNFTLTFTRNRAADTIFVSRLGRVRH